MTDVTIFTGITGMNKKAFIQKLIEKSGKKDKILFIDFESELTDSSRHRLAPSSIPAFLDMISPYTKMKIISDAFESSFKKIIEHEPKVEHVFFSIHLSYFKNSEFFPPFNPQLFSSHLSKISKPNVKIINLIDDVFSIWNRIKKKEVDYPNTSMRLREILSWRSLEYMQSLSLENSLKTTDEGSIPANTYLVSVRHPYSTFYNLIFYAKPTIIYLSYPITKTRITKKGTNEINQYRKKLHEIGKNTGAVIFDPVTIDELSLVTALNESKRGDVKLKDSHRWPLETNDQIMPAMNWPIKIPKQEIEEAKNDIKNQVRSRDFVLVDAANHLAVYRPLYKKHKSEGVDAEIKHAIERGSTVDAFSPKSDGLKPSSNPFWSQITIHTDERKFLARIQRLIENARDK